jgi:hypothetical protein
MAVLHFASKTGAFSDELEEQDFSTIYSSLIVIHIEGGDRTGRASRRPQTKRQHLVLEGVKGEGRSAKP